MLGSAVAIPAYRFTGLLHHSHTHSAYGQHLIRRADIHGERLDAPCAPSGGTGSISGQLRQHCRNA
jgi:hypothetical protein